MSDLMFGFIIYALVFLFIPTFMMALVGMPARMIGMVLAIILATSLVAFGFIAVLTHSTILSWLFR